MKRIRGIIMLRRQLHIILLRRVFWEMCIQNRSGFFLESLCFSGVCHFFALY
jgi:hypothetical protein